MKVKRLDWYISVILFIIGIVSRAPFVEKIQSHWDGPQYTIGILRYSFLQQTPAPPGYPLYIALGRFFYIFLKDPHQAILAVSVLGAGTGALILYLVGIYIFNRYVGLAASLIFLSGSTFYYFGLTPYAYGILVSTTTLVAFSAYRIFIQKKQDGWLFGLVTGISFALRPQELFQTAPLFILGFIFLRNKQKIISLIIFLAITAVWLFISFYLIGFAQYFTLSYALLAGAVTNHSLFQRIVLVAKGYLLSFGISSVFIFYYIYQYITDKKSIKKNKKMIIFFTVWIAPGLLYNLLFRTEHAGYQMSYLAGFLVLLAYAIWKITQKHYWRYGILLAIIVLFNLYWFFYNRDPNYTKPYRPTSFHYSDIRKNDLKTGSKVTFVEQHFNPKDTLILTDEVLWRPYSYYLKNYQFLVLFRLDSTTVPYDYGRIDSRNWDFTETNYLKDTIRIPNNYHTIVLMDDGANTWVKKYPFKTFPLPGNSTVESVAIPPNTLLKFSYASVSFEKAQEKK